LLHQQDSRFRHFIQEIHMKKTLAFSLCAALPLMMSAAYGQTSPSSSPSPSSPASSTTPDGAGGAAPSASGSGGASTSPQSGGTGGMSTHNGTMGGAAPAGPGNAGAARDKGPGTKEINGQSVKSDMMGESVYNDQDEKIGSIKDVVLDSNGKVTDIVIGAGGFLGMGEHDVAVPFSKVTQSGDKLILQGYTKDQLKALPRATVTH
jgi:sporulation protein YlmC with PRC-barrel domain